MQTSWSLSINLRTRTRRLENLHSRGLQSTRVSARLMSRAGMPVLFILRDPAQQSWVALFLLVADCSNSIYFLFSSVFAESGMFTAGVAGKRLVGAARGRVSVLARARFSAFLRPCACVCRVISVSLYICAHPPQQQSMKVLTDLLEERDATGTMVLRQERYHERESKYGHPVTSPCLVIGREVYALGVVLKCAHFERNQC